uniref:Integrase zinc-binding domain-containing protein n=1 Tax=Timema poppense TaxID=170557 RepID=A0A7R9HAQ2_TIMPO|nr:unnamed protein product [Timema poppensis]
MDLYQHTSRIQRLHVGHLGVVETKLLVDNYVWWLRMNNDIENYVLGNHTCQEDMNGVTPLPGSNENGSTLLPAVNEEARAGDIWRTLKDSSNSRIHLFKVISKGGEWGSPSRTCTAREKEGTPPRRITYLHF